MNLGVTTARPRYGHLMVMFGLFLSLLTLTFQATNPGRSYAFGISEVAQLSNTYRTNAGLAALVQSQALNQSAQAKAEDMAAKGYFAHNSPDGTTPWTFFANAGYSYITAGENLALSNQSASSVVTGWYDSPGHRANLLSTDFTEVGYGVAFTPSFTYGDTVYSDVYLVAAHYAKPTASIVAAATTDEPTPAANTSAQTVAQAQTTPAQQQAAPTAEPTPEPSLAPVPQSTEPASAQPATVATSSPNGTEQQSGAGVTTVAKKNPVILSSIAYGGLAIGIVLVIFGTAVELRRLLKHQPLLPHLPHHR